MEKRILMLFACMLFALTCAFSQVTQVIGVVTAEDDGQPITGASIRIEGTKLGTVTDVDGKFHLSNIPANARTLVITYILLSSLGHPSSKIGDYIGPLICFAGLGRG